MNSIINFSSRAGLLALIFSLTACGTTDTSSTPGTTSTATNLETSLPLIRTGATVATGAVLNFAVTQTGTRTRLANEMYSAANAVYSLTDGTFPTPAQFRSTILAFGGSQQDAAYAQFASAIGTLYASYYPKLMTGDRKAASELLNAISGGIQDATSAYVTAPVVATGAGS